MKKKGIIAVFVGLSICVGAVGLTGCDNRTVSSGDENGNTFTYWTPLPAAIATHVQSYNEVEMYKELEKKTGIHIDFIHPAAGQEHEQFNLMLASREYPDMVEYSWTNYNGGVQKAIDDNVIIALNDYLDELPSFKNTMTGGYELSEIYRKNSTTDSGQYFGFTALNTGNYRIFGGPCIRRDLLKKYNLEIPETIDDWTNVLTTFKKNGISIPLTGDISSICTGGELNFAGAFGVGGRWYVDNGKIKYGPMEDGFRDYLALMNKWYKEGLLDRDISTNQTALIDSKIVNGDSAALVNGYLGGALGKYLAQKETDDPAWDIVGTPYPVLKKGDINEFPRMEADVGNTNIIAITTACKNPLKAAKWCDYFYSEEGLLLTNFGVEGKSYTMVDGKPVYAEDILNNKEGLSVNEAISLNCRATSPAPGFNQAGDYLEQYYKYEQQKESFKMWEANTNLGRVHKIPALFKTAEESDVLTSIEADLGTYVNEMIWNFISGEEALDNYGDFVNTLKKQFRIEECINIYQNVYDRYSNK